MDDIKELKQSLEKAEGEARIQILVQLSVSSLDQSVEVSLEYGKQAYKMALSADSAKWQQKALCRMGIAREYGGNREKAMECYSQALALAEKQNDKAGIAESLFYTGNINNSLGNYEISDKYIQQALSLYTDIGDKKGIANCYSLMGFISKNTGKFTKALECHQKGLSLYGEIDYRIGIANSLNGIGVVYKNIGDYDKSLEYHLRSLKIKEELDYKKGIASSLNNIGLVYHHLKNYPKALECHLKSLAMEQESGDKNGIAGSLVNIGLIYDKQHDNAKALEYYLKANAMYEECENKNGIAYTANNIGEIYCNLGNYQLALEYYQKSLRIKEDIGDSVGIASTLNNIGYLRLKMNDPDSALSCYEKALMLGKNIGARNTVQQSYKNLSELYEMQDEYSKALEHYKLYAETKDSIFTEDSSKKIAEMQTKYETEKKEKEAEIYRLRNVELAEANQAITQAKEIIEEKNRHITSSIEYARRIQQAVLPPAGKMQAALPEHFVLFKPRDIVSGDFYWFSQTRGKTLIAVVDCTGHGVPGAFMSMIGSMLLNTIVNENGETGPAKVLEQLHVAVRNALKQHDAEADTTDGMDVCLCAIEQGAKRLMYAGAKRPLYLVRNAELTEIAGDGKSIGGRQKEEKRAFSDKQIALQDGDMLYLTSDGYSDQCNADGRKIGSRRLKELLTEISGQDQEAQRTALLSELERHQGTEEQRDDIAVIGIQVKAQE